MKEIWYSKSPFAEFCIVNTASGYVAYWRSDLLTDAKWSEYDTYQSIQQHVGILVKSAVLEV